MATNMAAPAMSPSQPQSPCSVPSSASAYTTTAPSPARAPCSLLRLPAELLQQIYYYLPLGTPSYPRLLARDTWMQAAPSHATPALQTPPLARTCRRLRADVLALYLGDLRVELCDSNELDGVFLDRCLKALGSAVLHVKRLTVEHKVDICIDEGRRDVVRKRAETVFEVKGPLTGEADEVPGQVEITCHFERTTLLGDERLPEDSDFCNCPISTILSKLSSNTPTAPAANETTQSSIPPIPQPQSHSHSSTSHAQIFPSPLTTSILTFLALLDTTSSPPGLEARPRYQTRNLSLSPHGWFFKPIETTTASPLRGLNAKWWPWPLCPSCSRKKYFLQGPITGDCLPNPRGISSSASRRELGYVDYAGHRWISCPYVPAKQSAENFDAANDKYSSTFKCRWGPARPRLVKPYGAKSRALLRQERDFLFN